jgi:hypothetical protein
MYGRVNSANGVVSDTEGFATQEGTDMRKLACLLLMVAGMFSLGGCLSTPAYSGSDNFARTVRDWDFEAKIAAEDVMGQVFMTIPPTRLTTWNLR